LEIKTIDTIYSPGSATDQEDGMINSFPIFGVIDAFSAPYDPEQGGPIRFDGLSGGEKIRQIILKTFYSADQKDGLERIILRANKNIAEFWTKQKIPLNRSDLLAGASFVFAKIMPDKKSIKIIQGGDCIAGWIHGFTNFNFTPNQAYDHDSETIRVMAEIMEKNKGSRKGLWRDHCPQLCRLRLRDQNQPHIKTGLAVLNGQPGVKYCWQKIEIPTKNLDALLLFSDGFAPDIETGVTKESIIKAIKFYRGGNLNDFLKETISLRGLKRSMTHTDFPEATALGIKFLPQSK
jgi:hypothetical protein